MNTETQPQEELFHTYISTMENHKLITPYGGTLIVKGYRLATSIPREIAFLDAEIAAGFPYLTKGPIVPKSDLDPMAEYKKRVIADYLAEQEAKKLAENTPDATLKAKLSELDKAIDIPNNPKPQDPVSSPQLKPTSTVDLSAILKKSDSK